MSAHPRLGSIPLITKPDVTTEPEGRGGPEMDAANRNPLIEVCDVVHRYPLGNVTALDHVSCLIEPGEHVAIIGKSGSGKTTLLNLIGGLDRPTSGEVRFDGETLAGDRMLDRHRASNVGFVFQTYYLLPNLTAAENIQIPLLATPSTAARRTERARDLLALVGLSQRADHLPSQLSGGECQRVAIARALSNEPSLILADEPTGALDTESGKGVLDLLEELNGESGTALVVVTHDEHVASRADRSIRLLDGRVVQSG